MTISQPNVLIRIRQQKRVYLNFPKKKLSLKNVSCFFSVTCRTLKQAAQNHEEEKWHVAAYCFYKTFIRVLHIEQSHNSGFHASSHSSRTWLLIMIL